MSIEKHSFRNILLIQLRRIGDVLMTTPSIRAIRETYPDAQISFLTEPPSHQVLRHNPYLTEVLVFQKKASLWQHFQFLWQIRQKHFDLVIDFFGNPRSALISWFSGAKYRIGFDFPGRGLYYTHCVDLTGKEKYAAEHKSLLLEPLKISLDSLSLDFFVDETDREYVDALFQQMHLNKHDFIVSISPVSRQPYKVWPAQNFSNIADRLIEVFGAKILFTYGPGEKHFVEQVRHHMHHQALPDYPVPTLSQAKAIFERVDLHLGNDNGLCHFAIAAGIPTVAIFGKPKALNWTPPQQDRHRAVEYDPGCKNQCSYPKCDHLNCINGIEPEKVARATFDLIEHFQLKKAYV